MDNTNSTILLKERLCDSGIRVKLVALTLNVGDCQILDYRTLVLARVRVYFLAFLTLLLAVGALVALVLVLSDKIRLHDHIAPILLMIHAANFELAD